MAPRAAKTKKVNAKNETKNAVKAKVDDAEIIEDAPVIKNKQKQTKKATNEKQLNGHNDENPAVKKGRKNKVVEEPQEIIKESDDDTEETKHNSHNEVEENKKELQKNVKGNKKPKKAASKVIKKLNDKEEKLENKDNEELNNEEPDEDKPKLARKGRGRKTQAKVEKESESLEEEEVKEPSAKRSKKTKQTTLEHNSVEKNDEKVEEEKKPLKGKRNQTKKEKSNEDMLDIPKEATDSKKKKGSKKQVKSIEDASDAVELSEEGEKKGDVASSDNSEESAAKSGKRKCKPAVEKAASAEPTKKVPKNKNQTNYEEIDFSSNSKTATGKEWNFKISSWNVDGIRAWLNKGGLDYVKYEKPDILCLQEVKCGQDKLPDEITNLPGYHAYWLCSDKDGYAGVGIYTTKLAINVQYGLMNEELDSEGRIITAEYEQFYLICTYVPNAGRKLVTLPKRLQWNEEFRKHVKELDSKKPVIICGDMNVAHNEIDLKNPKTNTKNAGFTQEERTGMTDLLGEGFIDTFRHLYPDKKDAYTFWTYMMNSRAKNVGWRLDYFIVSQRLASSLCDCVIRDQVYGSDHCPITMFLNLNGSVKLTQEFSPKS